MAIGPMNIVYSCVIDAGCKLAHQALVWAVTLQELAGISPQQLVVHCTTDCPESTMNEFRAAGLRVEIIPPHAGSPYCNKVQQLLSPAWDDADVMVLCDADLAWAGPLDARYLTTSAISAKVVDGPNPPEQTIKELLADANLTEKAEWASTTVGGHTTLRGNCNGGLYVIPKQFLEPLKEAWPRWAEWMCQKWQDGKCTYNVDQLSFAFSVLELGIPIQDLDIIYNFPMHLVEEERGTHLRELTPVVLHYHHLTDASGVLKQTGIPAVDEVIGKINATIRANRRKYFSNQIFWNYRYASNPELGSGVGSRGVALKRKQDLLNEIIGRWDNPKVLDVGCGDLETSRNLNVTDYTGLDISVAALELAAQKRPDWKFTEGPLDQMERESFDVVICFDVLIHQNTREKYEKLLTDIADRSRDAVIIGAYNQPGWFTSEITFYYEPLTDTLRKLGFEQLEIVGGYRDTTVILAQNRSLRVE